MQQPSRYRLRVAISSGTHGHKYDHLRIPAQVLDQEELQIPLSAGRRCAIQYVRLEGCLHLEC